jgi:predicted nucleotidyltransferase
MPMKIDELLKAKRQEILAIAARHGAHNLRVFGSVARGEAGPESDLDILVEMEPSESLLDHVALMQDLEDLLQRKVDLVSERACTGISGTECLPRQLHYEGRKTLLEMSI